MMRQGASPDDLESAEQPTPSEFATRRSLRVKHTTETVGLGHGVENLSYGSCLENQVKFGDKERQIRLKAKRNRFINTLRANFTSIIVFLFYLVSFQTVCSCSLTVGMTLYWYYYAENESILGSGWKGSSLNWVVLGFAIVTPLTMSIGMAFTRREQALSHIARVRSSSFQLYLAHAIWTNWNGGSDRTNNNGDNSALALGNDNNMMNWLNHADVVMGNLIGLCDELSRFLTLPTSSRSYHRMLHSGRRDAAEIVELQYSLFDSFYTQRIITLTILTEKLKNYGLSPTEASRIRQYEQQIGEAIEGLRIIKMYRTPQPLRSFGRLFIILLPPLYAASFTQLAFDLQSLPMGIIFALITPLCLTALFESINVLEDPFFRWITLDGIDCVEELEVLHWHQLKNARKEIFPNAEPLTIRDLPVSSETRLQSSSDIFDATLLRQQSAEVRYDTSRISHYAMHFPAPSTTISKRQQTEV